MFKNYLKTAWRNLRKNKIFSTINIAGLAIGMAACIIILLFVGYERSFDKFHTKNIYRLDEVQKFEGMVAPQNVALSMFPMGPTLKKEFPEIRNFTRVRSNGQKTDLTYGDKKIFVPAALYVDSTFLQLFDFKLIKGDRATALQQPNSALLTAETASKLFGNDDPMGKTIMRYVGDTIPFRVTGVLENTPQNSHLQFDALFSFNTIIRPEFMNNWGGNWLVTYLELAPDANAAALQKKFPAYTRQYLAAEDRWKNYELFLQSLEEVHAGSTNITHDYLNYHKFDKTYTYLFSVIAAIILIIACINFMNLSTARSAERAREVGIRKSIGAQQLQLAVQFIGESVLLAFIALILALVIVTVSLPFVNDIGQRPLKLPLFSDPGVMLIIIAGTIVVGVISGLYPAGYLSSFKPVKVLKGTLSIGKNKSALRNVLVIGQFSCAVFLIIATTFAIKQLRYMQHKDPGFNRDQVMLIPLDAQTNGKFNTLKQEFLSNSAISSVTAYGQRLGNNLHQTGVRYHGEGPAREITTSLVNVDPDYLSLYKISLLAGRNFSTDGTDNGKAYIINETMARKLLSEDNSKAPLASLIGRRYGFDSLSTIIGIARDFNFNSLHHKIETLSIYSQKDWGFGEMSVKIAGTGAGEAIAHVQAVWNKQFPDHPFEYSFLDQHFAELYRADAQVSEIVGILASLAIIISCLGLFGLASYSAERRVKEIGIRKALGASVENIVSMLSRDFVKLVLIANLIAIPVAWFGIYKWLQDFAYRIDISWWVFVAAAVAAVLIALFTVSFQAIKAARANPVNSLKMD